MSLIDEALKRARQEAALQDAAQREAQFRRVPVYTPAPPRSRGGLVMAGAGLVIGLALALGLAFAAGWLPAGRSGDAPQPAREERRAEAAAPAPRIVEEAAAPVDRTDRTDPADPTDRTPAPRQVPVPTPTPFTAEPRPTTPQPEAAPPAPEARAAVEPVEPAPVAAPPVAEAPVPAPPPPEATPAAPAAPVSYVRQVPVPGGGTLELSGIAFSAERPVALINGKPWVPGEVIQGYTIVAVEPGRVQLDGHGQKVFVTLK